jgi:hypothetical protein
MSPYDIVVTSVTLNVVAMKDWYATRHLPSKHSNGRIDLFGTRYWLNQLRQLDTSQRRDTVNIAPSIFILSSWGDTGHVKLDMTIRVAKLVSTGFFNLRRFRTSAQECRQSSVSYFILSRINYCNVVLAGPYQHQQH